MATLGGGGGGQGMNNLTTLIKRLEAATSRLEDIAASSVTDPDSLPHNGVLGVPTTGTASTGILQQSSSAPDLLSTAQKSVAPVSPPQPEPVAAMDRILETEVKSFVDASQGIDSLSEAQTTLVARQASFVKDAFTEHRRFILVSTQAKKPADDVFGNILQAQGKHMDLVKSVRESYKTNDLKEHFAMVNGGIDALMWMITPDKPKDYMGAILGGTQTYGNRVLTKYKATGPSPDAAHVKYVSAYYALIKGFQEVLTKHYPAGLTWNNNGVDASVAYSEASSSSSTTNGAPPAPSPSAAGGPPPPPPPPPLPQFDNIPGQSSTGAKSIGAESGGMSSVFSALNSENVTSGLKKVDKSQMTHKNPSLRTTAIVPGDQQQRSKSPAGPGVKPKPESMRRQNSLTPTPSNTTTTTSATKKPPQKELDGNKWLISNWTSPNQPLEIEITSFTQSVLITACTNTTVILKGKANAISIDNSPRLQLLVDTLVSSIDVIKSPNVAVQITGAVPTILLDQVDGATIYLGAGSLGTEVFTSKCSGVNVVLPPVGEDGGEGEEGEDSKEVPVPEQIRTFVRGGRLVSEIVEHAG